MHFHYRENNELGLNYRNSHTFWTINSDLCMKIFDTTSPNLLFSVLCDIGVTFDPNQGEKSNWMKS